MAEPERPLTNEQDQPFSPLVGAIFTQMFEQSASITTQVMDNYQAQVEVLEAELYAIRNGVSLLLSGPYMPMPDAIRRAVFYPDKELIEEYKANKEVGW